MSSQDKNESKIEKEKKESKGVESVKERNEGLRKGGRMCENIKNIKNKSN